MNSVRPVVRVCHTRYLHTHITRLLSPPGRLVTFTTGIPFRYFYSKCRHVIPKQSPSRWCRLSYIIYGTLIGNESLFIEYRHWRRLSQLSDPIVEIMPDTGNIKCQYLDNYKIYLLLKLSNEFYTPATILSFVFEVKDCLRSHSLSRKRPDQEKCYR